MRIAQCAETLLKLLFDLLGGSFRVFRNLFRCPLRCLLNRQSHFLLPARVGRFEIRFQQATPSHRGCSGDLFSKLPCGLIHFREPSLGFLRAQIHLFFPAPDFIRRSLSGRYSQLIHDRPNFVLILAHASAEAFHLMDGRLKLVLNLLLEFLSPRTFHFRQLIVNFQAGLA